MGKTPTRVPFNGVDSVMRGLDDRRRPQTIEFEVALADRLDDQRLRDAVTAAAGRHAMARAHQLPARPFDLNDAWGIDAELAVDPVEVRTTGPDADDLDDLRDAFSSRHVAVDAAPPFRVLLVHGAEGDRVLLSVCHAAFDGIGSIRLLQSISRAYAGEDDPVPDVDPLEVRGLLDRDRSGVRPAASARPTFVLPPRPARIATSQGTSGADGFGVLRLDLAVADAEPPPGASVNDVLLAALHLTVERWNRSHGAPCGEVTVMMPVNRRPAAWRGEVLANLVLSGRVATAPADRARPDRLLQAVVARTKAIKAGDLGGTEQMAKTSQTPVALRRLLPHVIDAMAHWTADTTVLSNLGRVADPPWFGGAGRGLWFTPPPREPLAVAVGAATTGDRLGIGLRWCRSALSSTAGRALGDVFVTALEDVRA